MKKMIRYIVAGSLVAMLSLSMTGCYTVIRRSGSAMDEQDRYLSDAGYAERWIDPQHIWYDPFYHWYYPSAYGPWRYYYTHPWWWNDYWFWDPGPDRPGAAVDTERHIWDGRRKPDWSSPPSSPTPPSTASQPSKDRQEKQPQSSTESSPQKGQRRRPDLRRGENDRSESDLQQHERMGDEEESDGNR
jgi:hypothetical protein